MTKLNIENIFYVVGVLAHKPVKLLPQQGPASVLFRLISLDTYGPSRHRAYVLGLGTWTTALWSSP
jgi:hypothetical protein